MRWAAVAGLVAAALLGGCGGAEPSAEPAPVVKTPQQLAAEKLIAEYEATPGCGGCTGELRAKERAAKLFTYAGEGLVAATR